MNPLVMVRVERKDRTGGIEDIDIHIGDICTLYFSLKDGNTHLANYFGCEINEAELPVWLERLLQGAS